jgi:membrane-associated PAP2 superfamily phosphatase
MAITPASVRTAPAPPAAMVADRPFVWLLAALLATLMWDWSGLDLGVMQLLGTSQGFALRNQWWMEHVLHDGLRQLTTVIYLLLWAWALWPARWVPARAVPNLLPRRQRLAVVLLVALSLLAVNLIKNASLTSCPWDLQAFGGHASYVSHWNLWQGDHGSGHCFPGGHASSGFGFLALCLPWLEPAGSRPAQRALGLRLLMLTLGIGMLAGATQTLRGAHYPSHTLWTLVICGAVSLGGWRLAKPWIAQQIR